MLNALALLCASMWFWVLLVCAATTPTQQANARLPRLRGLNDKTPIIISPKSAEADTNDNIVDTVLELVSMKFNAEINELLGSVDYLDRVAITGAMRTALEEASALVPRDELRPVIVG
jgi:hypothetical protein